MCDQAYYYIDSSFQLELNLQSIRRALIEMLEEFEAADCTRCRLIKCRCEPNGPTPPQSPTGSNPSPIGSNPSSSRIRTGERHALTPMSFAEAVGHGPKSPAAIHLPRPEFTASSGSNDQPQAPKDIESWVRASTPNADQTHSPASVTYDVRPLTLRNVWNDYKNKINQLEINTATISQTGNVQDFFKSFNANMCTVGDRTYMQNKVLMQKLKSMANKPEYTYF